MKAQINTALSAAIDAEAATRNYLLARDAEADARFREAGDAWRDSLAPLIELVKGDPAQMEHIRRLDGARDDRLDTIRSGRCVRGHQPRAEGLQHEDGRTSHSSRRGQPQ